MTKTLLTILAATTMFTTVAKAEVSKADLHAAIESGNSHVCRVLPGFSGINQSILTPQNECWLDVHRADKAGGSDFGVVWAKIAGKYYSVPLKDIQQAGGKAAAKELFSSIVGAQVSADQIASAAADIDVQIESVQTEINNVIVNSADLELAKGQITVLNAEIDALTAMRDFYKAGKATAEAARDLAEAKLAKFTKTSDNWHAKVRERLNVVQAQLTDAIEARNTARRDLALANNANADLTAQVATLSGFRVQAQEAATRISALNNEVTVLRTALGSISATPGSYAELAADYTERGLELGRLTTLNAGLESDLADVRADLMDVRANLLTAEGTIETQKLRIEELEGIEAGLVSDVAYLRGILVNTAADVRSLTSTIVAEGGTLSYVNGVLTADLSAVGGSVVTIEVPGETITVEVAPDFVYDTAPTVMQYHFDQIPTISVSYEHPVVRSNYNSLISAYGWSVSNVPASIDAIITPRIATQAGLAEARTLIADWVSENLTANYTADFSIPVVSQARAQEIIASGLIASGPNAGRYYFSTAQAAELTSLGVRRNSFNVAGGATTIIGNTPIVGGTIISSVDGFDSFTAATVSPALDAYNSTKASGLHSALPTLVGSTGVRNGYAVFDALNADQIFDAIGDAYDAGYESGYEDGYADGYADGFSDGFSAGKATND